MHRDFLAEPGAGLCKKGAAGTADSRHAEYQGVGKASDRIRIGV